MLSVNGIFDEEEVIGLRKKNPRERERMRGGEINKEQEHDLNSQSPQSA